MGVQDLRLQNMALLLRWWWRLYTSTMSLWSTVIFKLKFTGTVDNGPRFWTVLGSFFWKKLLSLTPLFHFSIQWIIGDGKTTSYWRDPWNGIALITTLTQGTRPSYPRMSLRDAYPIRHELHTIQVQFNAIDFKDEGDRLEWKWTSNGSYSASSIYRIMSAAGKIESSHKGVWKLTVPPTVRVFAYLLLKEKLLTQDVMQRRNMGTSVGCQMCLNCPVESALHLFFRCPAAIELWCEVSANLGYHLMLPAQSVYDVWANSMEQVRRRGTQCFREWWSVFICACWHIWKRRNEKIFSGKTITSRLLADRVIQEGRLWLKYCNTGPHRMMGTNLLPDPD